MAAAFELVELPERKFSVRYRKSALRPYIQAAFRAGLSPSELYAEISGTTLGMRREHFFPFVNRAYKHERRAQAVALLDPSKPFLITALPQERHNIPDRFVATVQYAATLPTGETQVGYFTYGFDDRMTIAEIEADIFDFVGESFSGAGFSSVSVQPVRLVRQF